jgi:hypothetical protein
VATDLYGTDVLLTANGDFAVTPAGQLALITGPLCPAQALLNRLRVYRGELPLHPDFGNALAATVVGTKANDPTLVVSKVNTELRDVMQADDRFLSAQNIVATVDPDNPTRTGVAIELVLAGGDRLTVADVTDTPDLASFESAPETTDSLTDTELDDAFGEDPDAQEDDVPDLDEDLEGTPGDQSLPAGLDAFDG